MWTYFLSINKASFTITAISLKLLFAFIQVQLDEKVEKRDKTMNYLSIVFPQRSTQYFLSVQIQQIVKTVAICDCGKLIALALKVHNAFILWYESY